MDRPYPDFVCLLLREFDVHGSVLSLGPHAAGLINRPHDDFVPLRVVRPVPEFHALAFPASVVPRVSQHSLDVVQNMVVFWYTHFLTLQSLPTTPPPPPQNGIS